MQDNNRNHKLEMILHSNLGGLFFFQSLAKLEYLGARAMFTIPKELWNPKMIHHLNDEFTHHELISAAAKSTYKVLSNEEALFYKIHEEQVLKNIEDYTKSLIWKTYKIVKKLSLSDQNSTSLVTYLLVSYALERRVMKIYPHMASHIQDENVKGVLKKLISDEKEHLTYIKSEVDASLPADVMHETLKAVIDHEEAYELKWLNYIFHAIFPYSQSSGQSDIA